MSVPPTRDGDGEASPSPVRATTPGLRALVAAAGSIALITLIARMVGFGRWFVFSHAVGATEVGSVYQSVNAVPNVVFEIAAGGVLAAVAVPLVAASLARGERDDADATASALLTWAVLLLVPLGLVVLVAARPISAVLLGTDTGDQVELGEQLLRIFSIQLPLYGAAIVLAGVLQAHRRFVAAALAPLLSSVVVIATYLAYRSLVPNPAAEIAAIPEAGVLVLGIGTTLGVAALALPLTVPIHRAGVRLRPRLHFPAGVGSRVRSLAVAGLLAVAGQQIATLVVIRLANERGGAGTLNVFVYAQAVTLLPYAVLAVPLATAAFPSLAGSAAVREPAAGRAAETTLRQTWFATVVVGVLGAGLLVAVSGPVGRFFALLDAGGARASAAETLEAMSPALVAFAPSVPALAVIGLLTRAAYVRGRARVAGAVAGVSWLLTTVVPLALLEPGTVDGPTALLLLALGSSVGLALGAGALALLVSRSWGPSALRLPARPLAAAVTGVGVGAAVGALIGNRVAITSLVDAALIGAALGAGCLLLAGGVALALDRSLLARLRTLRPTPSVPAAVEENT
jgi:putative peptidoglycan lipid II flippase